MNSFLEWLFEAKMKNTHEFEAHNRMYLKNVITSILKNKIVDVGNVESNFIDVDKSVIMSLQNADVNTLTVDKFNLITSSNSTPFVWNSINKNNEYKGKVGVDSNIDAQSMESVICLAFNYLNNTLNTKEKSGLFEVEQTLDNKTITEDKLTESDRIKRYYLLNKDAIDACAKPLLSLTDQSTRFDKLEIGEEVSKEWLLLGQYKTLKNLPNKTPKTDIISNDSQFKVSLKKEIGAQLMSGKQSEAIATILTALYRTFGKKDGAKTKWPAEMLALEKLLNVRWIELHTKTHTINELKKIAKNIKDLDKVDPNIKNAIQLIQSGEESVQAIETALIQLCDTNENFKNNLLYEALTGRVKFSGKIDYNSNNYNITTDKKNVANYILEWNMEKPSKNRIYTISEYIKSIQSNVKFDIAFKSANGHSWLAFKIIVTH